MPTSPDPWTRTDRLDRPFSSEGGPDSCWSRLGKRSVPPLDAVLDFTLFARATCPAGPHKCFHGFHGVPVQCGRVVVNPGDIIVGDADGVTVVPVAQVGTVLAEVERVVTREREWIDRIRAGESSAQILGLE